MNLLFSVGLLLLFTGVIWAHRGGRENKDYLFVAGLLAATTGGCFLLYTGEDAHSEYPSTLPVQVTAAFQSGDTGYYIVQWDDEYAVVEKERLTDSAKIPIEVGQTYVFSVSNGANKVEKP